MCAPCSRFQLVLPIHIYLYTMTYLHLILDFYGLDVDHATSPQNSDFLSDFGLIGIFNPVFGKGLAVPLQLR